MRLLLIEDDDDLAEALKRALEDEDFAVDVASDGDDGLFKLIDTSYDAAIVDVMLPRRDGWSVISQARQQGVRTPVLCLTARDTLDDRVRGLNLGADDYLIKPFAVPELIARIAAIIRRGYGSPSPILSLGELTINTAERQVSRQGSPVDLTPREYVLLELLVRSRGRVISRADICEHLYSETADTFSNVVDVHIAALRRKLGPDVIRTRRGHGYIVDA